MKVDFFTDINLPWRLNQNPISPDPFMQLPQPNPTLTGENIPSDVSSKGPDSSVEKTANLDTNSESTSYKLNIVESLIEDFTGKDVEILDVDKFDYLHQEDSLYKEMGSYRSIFTKKGIKDVYHYKNFYKTKEKTKLDVEVTVITSDGEKLDVDIELGLDQEFIQKTKFNFKSKNGLDKGVYTLKSRQEVVYKSNFSFDIEIEKSKDSISLEEGENKSTPEIGPPVEDTEDSAPVKGPDLEIPEEVITNSDAQPTVPSDGEEGEEINSEVKNSPPADVQDNPFDLFSVWSVENSGFKLLLAIGIITGDKIYLQPVDQEGGNSSLPITKTQDDEASPSIVSANV